MKQKELISRIDPKAIVEAITQTEKSCSTEIRVHVEPRLRGGDILEVAKRTFERLGMTRTRLRNGVLLFIAAEEQRYAILGDQGIHEKVGDEFWQAVANHIHEHFKAGEFTEGIVQAIGEVGSQLACHFPLHAGDINELANEVSFGEHSGDHQPGQ